MIFQDTDKVIELGFTPIFVAGPGRSGTSVLHATLCTDLENNVTNEYVGECTYFTHILRTFYCVTNHFDSIYTSYFDKLEDFNLYHSNLIRSFLIDTWTYLGKPKNLILKAPGLILNFDLLAQILPEAKFVVSVRDPLDIAASMKTVVEKYEKDLVFDAEYLIKLANDIKSNYLTILTRLDLFKDKIIFIKYRNLVTGELDEEIYNFLGIKINRDNLWKSNKYNYQDKSGWLTKLYNAPSTDASVGRYQNKLTDKEIQIVSSICADIMKYFGYENPILDKESV